MKSSTLIGFFLALAVEQNCEYTIQYLSTINILNLLKNCYKVIDTCMQSLMIGDCTIKIMIYT